MRNCIFMLCMVMGSSVIAGESAEPTPEPVPDPAFSEVCEVDCCTTNCCTPRVRRFHCISPCDIFRATGGYVVNTTVGVAEGLGAAITAPFRTPICVPEPRVYEYRRPRWFYSPGFLRRVR